MFADKSFRHFFGQKRFEKCWLAATNPRYFCSSLNKNAVEELIVPRICSDIKEAIEKNLTNYRKHMSLRVITNLLLGTVRIHEHQVQFLYEKTQCLMTAQTSHLFGSRKRHRESLPNGTNEKRIRIEDKRFCLTYTDLHSKSSPLNLNDKEIAMLATPSNKNNELLNEMSLRESEETLGAGWLAKENYEDDGFGEMDEEEQENLLHMAKSQKIFSRARKRNASLETTKAFCEENLVKTGNGESTSVYPSAKYGVDLVRNDDFKNVLTSQQTSQPNFFPTGIESTAEDFAENVRQASTPTLLSHDKLRCDFFSNLHMQFIAEAVPNVNGLTNVKRRKIVSKLQYDNPTKIDGFRFNRQFNYERTLRHSDPKHDIVPLSEMKKINSMKLFQKPTRRIYATKLMPDFRRYLKTKQADCDHNIITQILDLPLADIVLPKQTVKEVKSNRKNGRSVVDQSSNTKENLQREVIEVEPFLSENIEIVVEKACHSIMDKTFMRNRRQEVLLRLQELWEDNQYPIILKTICGNVNRVSAALTFQSLLELSGMGHLELHKDSGTQEVIHISKRKDLRRNNA